VGFGDVLDGGSVDWVGLSISVGGGEMEVDAGSMGDEAARGGEAAVGQDDDDSVIPGFLLGEGRGACGSEEGANDVAIDGRAGVLLVDKVLNSGEVFSATSSADRSGRAGMVVGTGAIASAREAVVAGNAAKPNSVGIDPKAGTPFPPAPKIPVLGVEVAGSGGEGSADSRGRTLADVGDSSMSPSDRVIGSKPLIVEDSGAPEERMAENVDVFDNGVDNSARAVGRAGDCTSRVGFGTYSMSSSSNQGTSESEM
jgi:hypothetical protein